VVPLWQEQIAAGGPLTITHPDMTRFFMTVPEAVQLVIQAAARAQGGSIFALDMGEPVRILDLVKDLVELSGLELGKNIDVVYTGLRPGEKLSEELFTSEELLTRTDLDKIMMVKTAPVDGAALRDAVARLSACAAEMDDAGVRRILHDLIPDFDPGAAPPPEGG
jgi:FlaA1/EpsC-like NDP-sugar epimerase